MSLVISFCVKRYEVAKTCLRCGYAKILQVLSAVGPGAGFASSQRRAGPLSEHQIYRCGKTLRHEGCARTSPRISASPSERLTLLLFFHAYLSFPSEHLRPDATPRRDGPSFDWLYLFLTAREGAPR